VFFHGAGGDATASLALVQQVLAPHDVLALLPTSAGSTWDLIAGGLGRDVATLDALLATTFDRYDVSGVALGGFSDGASYALSIGLANGDLVDAVLAFSPGFAAPPEQVGRPRVWISHGTADPVLPVDRCGRRTAQLVRNAGYDSRYEEFEGGHVVPLELLDRAMSWWLSPPMT
jgi:phospholipase/carboxylesterase